jgi:hypothetical protein
MSLTKMPSHQDPVFGFDPPVGYEWLKERKLVGYEPHSQLQPWYYLDAEDVFSVTDEWHDVAYGKGDLIAFARRQDCDDIACFSVRAEKVNAIVTVHGWTPEGYCITDTYESIWNWLKSVIDDIALLVEMLNRI